MSLTLGTFFISAGAIILVGVLPNIALTFDRPVSIVGLLVPAYALPMAVMIPFTAVLTRKFKPMAVLAGGLVLAAAGMAILAVSPSFEVAVASRLVSAAGAALFLPASVEVTAQIVPPLGRARAIAILMAGVTIASASAAALGTLLSAALGWQGVIACLAGFGIITAASTVVFRTVTPAVPPTLRERFAQLRARSVAFSLIATFLLLAGNYAAYLYIALVLDRATGGQPTSLAVMLAVYGVASIVGTVAGGAASDRFGWRIVFRFGATALVLAFAALPSTADSLAAGVIVVAIWGMSVWLATIALQAHIALTAPQALGWNTSATFLGIAASGIIGSMLISIGDPHWLSVLLVPLLILAVVVVEIGGRQYPRPISE